MDFTGVGSAHIVWEKQKYCPPLNAPLALPAISRVIETASPGFVFFSSRFCFVEGLHRLRHKCQATDPLHASEQAVFSVQDVEICGVPSL